MLVIDISINGRKEIVRIGAVRIFPSNVDEDTICTYEVGRIYDGRIKRPLGTLEHRYGDMAEVLAEKALSLVNKSSTTSSQEDVLELVERLAVNNI